MGQSTTFGRRKQPHMIVIAQGDRIRHFSIRPWVAALCGAAVFAGLAGYLIATGYLIMRDDLINAAVMRQARVQHAYEDRIAALRAQVDRITSHRLLDQQFMESKIAELATRQSALAARAGTLEPLLERARDKGLSGQVAPVDELPIPALRPGADQASLDPVPGVPAVADNPLFRGANATTLGAHAFAAPARPAGTTTVAAQGKTDRLAPVADPLAALDTVTSTLERVELEQLEQIDVLTRAAYLRRNALIEAAKASGLPVRSEPVPLEAVGGPFVPLDEAAIDEGFEAGLAELSEALDALEQTRGEVTAFPIAHPVPGRQITSGFGKRRDPILGRSAFHAGIDFRAPTGTTIRAPAAGKVVKAGRSGGYGIMVEIDHGNGLTTRFAHMSRLAVKAGQTIEPGQKIGASGNTGRSTGPHLHYEVRAGGKAVNPMRYLKAGTRIGNHL